MPSGDWYSSIMKYVGSKNRLAKFIAPIMQQTIDDNDIRECYEPFVGGCNMIDKIKCDRKLASDNNKYLIAFWQKIADGWDISQEPMSKELYADIRANPNDYPPEQVALAGFCASYNAKWFGGYAGIVTTKTGVKRNYYGEAVRNVMKQAPLIKDIEFSHRDYLDIIPPPQRRGILRSAV